MQDITAVHDKVGVYSHWMYSNSHERTQEPWLTKYHHDYFEGRRKPNYPVPATLINADAATIHRWICGHCPDDNGPCRNCIDEYIDALEYHSHWID